MTQTTSPVSADDLYEMALRSFGREQCARATALVDACLELRPDHIDAWLLQAEIHLYEDRPVAALACLTRAAAADPPNATALNRLTGLYLRSGRPDDALKTALRLKGLQPNDPDVSYSLAVTQSRAGDREAAYSLFQDLLRFDPEDARSAIEASWLALGQKRFSEGWRLWERRFGLEPCPGAAQHLSFWDGSALSDRKILVLPEGGYGDTVWAARFLPALKKLGAEIHFLKRPALNRLFENLDGVDFWVDNAEENHGCELQVSVLSLPSLLGVEDPQQYPPPRLHPDADWGPRRDELLRRSRAPLRVGVLWSGSVSYGGNADRAARLADFLPLAELPFVQLYSLQKGPPQRELIESGIGDLVIDCDDFNFSETALLIQSLDLIIMTDSAVAHIAGSVGTPVWVLLDTFPYWYHGFEGRLSDWYPGMRFFRQSRSRDWRNVFSHVQDELETFARENKFV